MPLSERDQIVLDQIEQDLRGEDPELTLALEPAGVRSVERRSIMLVLAGVLVGMTLVLAGLVAKIVIFSVVGFLIIVAAVAHATTRLSAFWPSGENQSPLRFPTR